MRRFTFLLLFASACGQTPSAARAPLAQSDVRSLDSVDARPRVFDPPPTLSDDAPPPKPRDPAAAANQTPLSDADDQLRARLPFAPAIAMDAVDGSKVSIRASTPMVEIKGRVYYFSSEENKRLFLANPDQYLKGLFSKL